MNLLGRRVVVMGLGRSGRSAARLCALHGADVIGVDQRESLPPINGVRLELGPHRAATFLEADLIVVSPGVPPTQPELAEAEAEGVPVIGELALAADFVDVPCLAVTGTNGKSTVTSFTAQLLAHSGVAVFAGGNLGQPLSELAMDANAAVAVVECSSYQLERVGRFRPHAAVVLNLSLDHLERHGDLEHYGMAKCRVFANLGPDDWAMVPADDPLLVRLASGQPGRRAWLGQHPGVIQRGEDAWLDLGEGVEHYDLTPLAVEGSHNRQNLAVALWLARTNGTDPAALQAAIAELSALPHRMETVAEVDGVRWINDSKATNIEAARAGIGGLSTAAVVLLGGRAKGPGFTALAPLLARHRAVLCFGEAQPLIDGELTAAGLAHLCCDTLEGAVARARELAQPGDAVLLSPGCSSFDAFADFEQRGRVFTALARGTTPEEVP